MYIYIYIFIELEGDVLIFSQLASMSPSSHYGSQYCSFKVYEPRYIAYLATSGRE